MSGRSTWTHLGASALVRTRHALPVRSGQWPWRQSARALALRDGNSRSFLLRSHVAWHGMACDVDVVSCHRLSCLHLGARRSGEGCSVPCPCPRIPVPVESTALQRRAPARTQATKESYPVCIGTIVFDTLVGWFVCILLQISFSLFRSTKGSLNGALMMISILIK